MSKNRDVTDAITIMGLAGIGASDARLNKVGRDLNRSLTPNEKEVASRYAKTLFKPMVDKVLDRNQLLFWQKKDAILTTDEEASFNQGAYEVRDSMIYLRKNIATSGEVQLISSAVLELPGICSFVNQKVKYPFQINGISVGYGEAVNAATNAATLKYQHDRDVPAEIQHSTLVISQTSGGEIARFELSRLFQRDSSSGDLNDHIYQLSAPKYLRTDSEIQMRLILPNGATIVPITVAYFSYLNIELFGNELGPKSATR